VARRRERWSGQVKRGLELSGEKKRREEKRSG
jgi:hypothetical protein